VTGGSGNAAQLLAVRLCVVGSLTAINADELGVLGSSSRCGQAWSYLRASLQTMPEQRNVTVSQDSSQDAWPCLP
jgi:hypothetical protein